MSSWRYFREDLPDKLPDGITRGELYDIYRAAWHEFRAASTGGEEST